MRYRLRTLLIVLALGPAVLAGVCFAAKLALRREPQPNDLRALSLEILKRQNWKPTGDQEMEYDRPQLSSDE